MFYHNIDPILVDLGFAQIRYYGLFYVIGFLFSYFYFRFLIRQKKIDIDYDELDSLFVYVILGLILGARLFYTIVYDPAYFLANPIKIFAVWQGGLSFHGGLIGMMIAAYIFAKRNRVDFLDLADTAVIPAALCLALGRIGNFINGELYGRITDVPWAVKFPGAEGFRHPSQLYESFKNIVIFSILSYFYFCKKKFPKGFFLWLFVTLYPLFRFFVEFYREPDQQLGFLIFNLTMGQLLSIIMFGIGIVMLFKTLNIKHKKKKDK